MKRRLGPLILVVGAVLIAVGLLRGELGMVQRQFTYRNFDVPSDQSGVQYLTPGLPDRAHEGEYTFDGPVHSTPLIAIGIVFLCFYALRNWFSFDRKLGLKARGIVQWSAFAFARLGVFRVAGAVPVKRCTVGVFPFLNCQACEMATGACPIGQVQISLMSGSVPIFAAGVLVAGVASLGRWICGWMCPFGLFADITDRASVRRFTPGHRWRAGGFVVAALILLAVGIFAVAGITQQAPFCSTVCASGKLYGLLPYYATTASGDVARLGASGGLWVFVYHAALFALVLLAMILISGRAFCRYFCPCGAILGLGNRIAAVRIKHHANACTGCNLCNEKCPMAVDLSKTDFLTQTGCIRCGRCVGICKQGARTWEFPWARTLERKRADGIDKPRKAPKPVSAG